MIHSNITAWCKGKYNCAEGTSSAHANNWLLKIQFEVMKKQLECMIMLYELEKRLLYTQTVIFILLGSWNSW
jgi:hypothetical protein